MGEGLSAGMRCIFRRGRISNGSCKKSTSSTNNGQNSKQPNKPTVNDNTQSGNGYQKQRPHNFHNKYDTDDIPSNCKTISHSSSVPISICIIILISYIIFGTFLFHKILPWDILDSLYFCFTSLGTIGFGDKSPNGQIAQFAAAAYILIGMAVVAMCFSLIQSELVLWLRKCGVNDHTIQSPTDDIQLVTVTMTPKSWQRHNDFLGGAYNSLPRRSVAGFQRNTPIRRSAGPLENQMEYFVPRSVSEFNLSGVGDLALPPPRPSPVPIHITQPAPILMPLQKPREKMVTFEDETKCPHGMPTTPRKVLGAGQIVGGDIFMWREGEWDEPKSTLKPGDVIKVWNQIMVDGGVDDVVPTITTDHPNDERLNTE